MYLVDTNVISQHRKAKSGRADPNVIAWISARPTEQLYASVVTVRELETWQLLTARRDPKQGQAMREWLDRQLASAFAGRILPVTEEIARRTAEFFVPGPRPLGDAFIAATALMHGLTVVTRNVADFAAMGVKVLNPWEPTE